MAAVNHSVYVIGGTDCADTVGSVVSFDTTTNVWSKAGKMPTPRYMVAATTYTYNNTIVVAGGCNRDRIPVDTVDLYNPATNSWKSAPHMPTTRCHLVAVTIDDTVYVIGGFNKSLIPLNSVDAFSFKHYSWSSVSPMNQARWGHGAVAYDGKIYVAGGTDGDVVIHTIEVYDPSVNTWTNFGALYQPRYSFGIALIEGNMYVLGGSSDFKSSTMRDCEVCDLDKNDCEPMTSMDSTRVALGAAGVGSVVYAIGGIQYIQSVDLCQSLMEEYTLR